MDGEISELLKRKSLHSEEKKKLYEEVTDEDKYKSMKTDDLIKVADLLKYWARYDLVIHKFLAKERDRAESYRYLANEYKKEANSLTKPLRDERLDNYKYLMEYSKNAEKEAERIEKLQAAAAAAAAVEIVAAQPPLPIAPAAAAAASSRLWEPHPAEAEHHRRHRAATAAAAAAVEVQFTPQVLEQRASFRDLNYLPPPPWRSDQKPDGTLYYLNQDTHEEMMPIQHIKGGIKFINLETGDIMDTLNPDSQPVSQTITNPKLEYTGIIRTSQPRSNRRLAAAEAAADGGGYKKRKSNRIRPRARARKHKWSLKYKRSIDCKHPKGFSQRQHCKYGRKNMRKLTRKK
jgi:hypothetical protein